MSNNLKIKGTKKQRGSILENEKLIMLISLIISFVVWIGISANSGETVDHTLSDIPVSMDLSDDAILDGLTVVSIDGVPVDEFKASVRVNGNSVTVGSLTSSDVQVYGSNLGNIVTSGTYNVSLLARQQGVKTSYNIVSLNPSEVTVVVDRNITKEFEIEGQITASCPAEYYMGSPTFSSKTVTVSGPEQSVSKVSRAVVISSVDRELTETMTLENLEVTLLDADGKEIDDDSLVVEPVMVDATIPVLIKKTVPIVIDYVNKPVGLSINNFATVEPAVIEIAASEDVIDSVSNIVIGTLDFSELSYNEDSMEFEVVMPEGVRNLNNIDKAVVKFNFEDFTTKTFTLSAFQFKNMPEGFVAEYSPYSSLQVEVIGPESEIEYLKTSSFTAVLDLTEATTGSSDMLVNIQVNGITSCWVYGSYTVNVTVNSAAIASTDSEDIDIDSYIDSESEISTESQ